MKTFCHAIPLLFSIEKQGKKKQSAANDIVSFVWIRSGRGLRKQENFKSWISFKKESYVVFNDY